MHDCLFRSRRFIRQKVDEDPSCPALDESHQSDLGALSIGSIPLINTNLIDPEIPVCVARAWPEASQGSVAIRNYNKLTAIAEDHLTRDLMLPRVGNGFVLGLVLQRVLNDVAGNSGIVVAGASDFQDPNVAQRSELRMPKLARHVVGP